MLDSVQLRLLIGPIIPLTPPREVMDALSEVEVKVLDVGQSGFKLTFSIDKQSPLQILFLLTGGMPLLFMRVVIAVVVNGTTNVLIDGVITDNNIAPGDKGSNSTLTLMGKDLTALMDQSKLSGFPFPALPAEARVALMLLKYAIFGVIPLVIPSVLLFVPLPIDQIPSQQGTDLEYIRYLADQAGYVFYIDPGPIPGVSKAYWGPQIKVGIAAAGAERRHGRIHQRREPALLLRSGEEQDPAGLHLQLANRRQLPDSDAADHAAESAAGRDSAAAHEPASARSEPFRRRSREAADPAGHHDGPGARGAKCRGGFLRGLARRHALPQVLKARQLVGVRGAGPAFDGLYYVKSVTHKIKRGEYKQDFTLTRNGLVSTVPTVNL